MTSTNGANGTNGFHDPNQQQTPDASVILQAIEAIFNPRSNNEIRHAANELLENTKSSLEARDLGFNLAIDTSKDVSVRHYGLVLLDFHIRYVWDGYDEDLEATLRECILKLAQNVRTEDPTFFRNKVAHLWTIFAKRAWGTFWLDMDMQLVQLFEASEAHREMVLYILQTLGEDVFSRDDTLAATRSDVLSSAYIEIFTPEELMLDKNLPKTGHVMNVRHGSDGWLRRLSGFLDWALNSDQTAAVKTLEVLSTAVTVMPTATIAATGGIEPICRAIVTGQDAATRLHAVEAVIAVCLRERMPDDDALRIVMPLFTTDSVQSLQSLYQWAKVDVEDIDDGKYTLLQKTSKLLARLGSWIEKNPALLPASSDLPLFFNLLFEVARDLSLKVSEPVLRLWTHLLRMPGLRDSSIIQESIGPLMETCSQRLVRYEALPEDSNDPIVIFINEDFDTLPEKHMFLGNYRRYCVEVVEAAVRKYPVDAVTHILGQAQSLFREIQSSVANSEPRNFSKKSPESLRVDAQVMLVDASVKGYIKWLSSQADNDPQQNEQDRNVMLDTFASFFEATIQMQIKDPQVQKRVLSCLTLMTVKIFAKSRPDMGTQLLDRFFQLKPDEREGLPEYSEAAKSLSYLAVSESQKLAVVQADTLLPMYDELERRIHQKINDDKLDPGHALGYQNFLFGIVLHAKALDSNSKHTKLAELISPSVAAWQAPEFDGAVKDFASFYSLLGLSRLPEYVYSHNFHKIDNWSEHELDEEGKALRDSVNETIEKAPHKATRLLLVATFDKLRDDDTQITVAQKLWADAMPSILPNLMQSLRHAHTFGDRDSWPQMPDEMQHIIQKMLTDRFWQAGISNESMDDFYARVNSSKSSYEGFASAIRGAIRQIREKSYSILVLMARLEHQFYGLPELPEVLASNVYGTARSLSTHQWSVLLSMTDQLIRMCPIELRTQFLPTVLISLFQNLEERLTREWDLINRQQNEAAANDDLGSEMKSESILRMLTNNACTMANMLLDVDPSASPNDPLQEHRMHRTIMPNLQLLGQILMFLVAALRMRDSRSVTLVIGVFNRIIPLYRKPSEIRDFICDQVLKAAIQSFNEPAFVDSQKNLASLIAQIISVDESGPKSIILSLPNMKPDKVEMSFVKLRSTRSPHQGASVVLEMLQGLRGVSIHELGKMERPRPKERKERMDAQAALMGMEMGGIMEGGIRRGGEEELDGVAGMFGAA